MRKDFVFSVVLIAITMMATTPAFAGNYFGLDLGKISKAQVIQKLTADGAKFDANYSYKGRGKLASIKVMSFDRFNRLGRVREAWLQFDPDDVLYQVNITWADAGQTYNTVLDGLQAKYRKTGSTGFGFNSSQNFKDGSTEITLSRNTFGFGDNQSTALTYTYTPSLQAVNAAKAKIEEEIRRENAKRTGGDL